MFCIVESAFFTTSTATRTNILMGPVLGPYTQAEVNKKLAKLAANIKRTTVAKEEGLTIEWGIGRQNFKVMKPGEGVIRLFQAASFAK